MTVLRIFCLQAVTNLKHVSSTVLAEIADHLFPGAVICWLP